MSRNRLGETASPYLRQHADNPVHWWPWTPDAFAEARARNVPIHLSIGYAACHWCHVMAGESFSDQKIAAYLNDHFVNIKVDREERPDVDQIYMKALHALGEQGGWPLTMFISPDGEPFWGGTYFPPEPRWGRPGFPQILEGVSAAWQRGDEAVEKNRSALLAHLRQPAPNPVDRLPDPAILDQSAERILTIWDHQLGGIRGAPKFPSAPVLDLLWRASLRTNPGTDYENAVLTTLLSLCSGGIYDHLAGGFARYSVDERWLVPHFEKMLSDNGQLLSLMTRAWAAGRQPMLRDRIGQTADWLIAGMQLPDGGFATSLDADTDHVEGLTYVWTKQEIDDVLGADSELFCATYDVTEAGNWEGKTVLNRLIKGKPTYSDAETERHLADLRARLLVIRDARPQPARDEKVLADWNGVTIAALAEAATATGEKSYLNAAEKAFHFICGSMQQNGRLCHSWCDGRVTSAGLATDYTQMIRAAIALYSATGQPDFLDQAVQWFQVLEENYIDSGVIFLTPADNDDLIVRPTAATDEAMPSAAGILLQVAAGLFTLTGELRYRKTADDILAAHAVQIGRDIIGAASLQSGFDTMLRSRLGYVSGDRDSGSDALAQLVLAEADPALILITRPDDGAPPPKPVPATDDGTAKLYLCEADRCRPPVHDLEDVKMLLAGTRYPGRTG